MFSIFLSPSNTYLAYLYGINLILEYPIPAKILNINMFYKNVFCMKKCYFKHQTLLDTDDC